MMKKRKFISLFLIAVLIFTQIPQVAMADNFRSDFEEVEPNNSVETAQELIFDENGENRITLAGNIQNSDDVDWYKINLDDYGSVRVFYQGLSQSQYPSTDIYATKRDDTFGHVSLYEGIPDLVKDNVIGNTFNWYNHLPDNEVYIRVADHERMKNGNYHLVILYEPNSPETDPHEPNTIFDNRFNYYETTPIETGKLITSKWNSPSDHTDAFSIEGNTNKGTLSFEVHHTQKEMDSFDSNSHRRYELHAERTDSTYEPVDVITPKGLIEEVTSLEVDIDNENYTGKYALVINNSNFIDDYKVKMDFVDTTENDEGIEVPEPEEPKEPEIPVEPGPKPIENISSLSLDEVSHDFVSFTYDLPKSDNFAQVNVFYNGERVAQSVNDKVFINSLEPNTRYQFDFQVQDKDGNVTTLLSSDEIVTDKYFGRISGSDRYKTSAEFLDRIEANTLDHVFVASGTDFPDSLAGSVLNNTLNGAVTLITDHDKIINDKVQEIKRVLKNNGKVFILGGEVAVSEDIEKKLKQHFNVERISGDNRAETSIEIAKKITDRPTELFITNGMEFADSLSITPYATKQEIPILLNTSKTGLSKTLNEYVEENKSIKKVTIIGGEVAVSKQVENELKQSITKVERISGDNRELTSLAIAEQFYPNADKVAISNGYDFPDSLSGSQFAYGNQMPILLVQKNKIRDEFKDYTNSKKEYFIYGGESVLSKDIKEQLR